MESLELFGREVLPEFAERDEQAANATRQQRLAPVIDAVMARKPAERPSAARPRLRVPRVPRVDADRQESDKFHRWLDDYAAKIAAGEDVSKRLA